MANNPWRPSKYNKAIVSKCWEYFAIKRPCDDVNGIKEVIPSIEGLSLYINLSRSNIYEWLKDDNKKDFQDIVNRILAKQGGMALNGGMAGTFNPKNSAVLLSKHNYREATDVDITTAGKPIEQSVINVIDKVYGNNPPTKPSDSKDA